MTVRIEVVGLRVFARHGVMEQERTVGNEFEVSAWLDCEVGTEALEDDRLEGTVNYAEVVDVISSEMARPSQLLEHVAWRISTALRSRFAAISGGRVRVAKITPPIPAELESVAVEISF